MSTLRGAWGAVRTAATAQPWTGFLLHAEYLAPGQWVSDPSSKGKVWRHVDADLPPTLVGASGKATASTAARSSGPITWASRWQWAKRTAFRTALRLAGARRRVTVPLVGEGQGNATVVVRPYASHGRAELLALSPGDHAFRFAKPGTYHHDYVEARRRFERHLPAPDFAVSDDGGLLIEDWCDGQLLSGLPVERQLSVVLEVLERYAALVADETVAEWGTVWQALPKLLDEVEVPAVLREPLADPRVRRLLNSGLLAPSQGDLSPRNIIADGQGSSWQVIDFDASGWLPVWWDPIALAGRMALFSGELNDLQQRALTEVLDQIWAAAGLDHNAAGLTVRHWAALVAIRGPWVKSTQASYLSGNGQFSEPDPHDFVWRLQQRANMVQAQLDR